MTGHAELIEAAADLMSGPSTALAAGIAGGLHADGPVCLVYDFDDTRRELVTVACAGVAAPGVRISLGTGVAGWVASRREVAVVVDRTRDARGDHLSGLDVPVAGVAVPVSSRHRYVGGVIEVYGAPPFPVTDAAVRLLVRLAAMLGTNRDAELAPADRSGDGDQFARSVVAAQETECKRLAADIHDGISQRLVSLAFHLSAARAALGEDEAFVAEQLRRARELADLAGAEARSAIGGLRPPMLDDLGLADSLASLARTCPGVVATIDIDDGHELPEHVQTALYRIAQEALQNVVKHSGARAVQVRLFTAADAVVLRVRDDGQGFDPATAAPAAGGLGLRGMRERAHLFGGRLTVTSRPGGGTVVEARVPWPQPAVR